MHMRNYIPTGNERVSLPMIREADGGMEALGFLYMAQKGMVELRGNDALPLILPFLQREVKKGEYVIQPIRNLQW